MMKIMVRKLHWKRRIPYRRHWSALTLFMLSLCFSIDLGNKIFVSPIYLNTGNIEAYINPLYDLAHMPPSSSENGFQDWLLFIWHSPSPKIYGKIDSFDPLSAIMARYRHIAELINKDSLHYLDLYAANAPLTDVNKDIKSNLTLLVNSELSDMLQSVSKISKLSSELCPEELKSQAQEQFETLHHTWLKTSVLSPSGNIHVRSDFSKLASDFLNEKKFDATRCRENIDKMPNLKFDMPPFHDKIIRAGCDKSSKKVSIDQLQCGILCDLKPFQYRMMSVRYARLTSHGQDSPILVIPERPLLIHSSLRSMETLGSMCVGIMKFGQIAICGLRNPIGQNQYIHLYDLNESSDYPPPFMLSERFVREASTAQFDSSKFVALLAKDFKFTWDFEDFSFMYQTFMTIVSTITDDERKGIAAPWNTDICTLLYGFVLSLAQHSWSNGLAPRMMSMLPSWHCIVFMNSLKKRSDFESMNLKVEMCGTPEEREFLRHSNIQWDKLWDDILQIANKH